MRGCRLNSRISSFQLCFFKLPGPALCRAEIATGLRSSGCQRTRLLACKPYFYSKPGVPSVIPTTAGTAHLLVASFYQKSRTEAEAAHTLTPSSLFILTIILHYSPIPHSGVGRSLLNPYSDFHPSLTYMNA
ncbi:hypothetical protein ABKN59_004675 [Abortiporus biennis]